MEKPTPKAGEILIKVHAIGINRADLLQRKGTYPSPEGWPEWPGLEVAGTVEAVCGENLRGFQVGDRVCALLGGGGYAEYVNVKYDMLMPVPEGCSIIEAAAMPEAFATAYLNLFIEGGIREGDTLLVTGGNSGLASVMIRMAKAFGIRVITTVRGAKKAAAIAPLGADVVVDTLSESLCDVLQRELDAGRGVDVAIDCLGGEEMGKCLHRLNRGARWIMIAALAGQMTNVDLKNIYVRNVRIIGSTLRSRAPEMKARILAELVEKVWPKVASGEIRPTIHAVLPITEAEAAQDILYKGENVGKVVLTVG